MRRGVGSDERQKDKQSSREGKCKVEESKGHNSQLQRGWILVRQIVKDTRMNEAF